MNVNVVLLPVAAALRAINNRIYGRRIIDFGHPGGIKSHLHFRLKRENHRSEPSLIVQTTYMCKRVVSRIACTKFCAPGPSAESSQRSRVVIDQKWLEQASPKFVNESSKVVGLKLAG